MEPDSTTVILDDDDEDDYYIVTVRDEHTPSKPGSNKVPHVRKVDRQDKHIPSKYDARQPAVFGRNTGNQSRIKSTLSSTGTFQNAPKKNDFVSAILKDGSPNLIKNLGLQNKKSTPARNPASCDRTKQKCTCKPNGFTNKPEEAIAILDSDEDDSDDCVITEIPPSNDDVGLNMECSNVDDNRHAVLSNAVEKKSRKATTEISTPSSSRAFDFGKSDQNVEEDDDDLVITDQYKLPKERVVKAEVTKQVSLTTTQNISSSPAKDKNQESNNSSVLQQPVPNLAPPQHVQMQPTGNSNSLPMGIQQPPGATTSVSCNPELYKTLPITTYAVPQASNYLQPMLHLPQNPAIYVSLPGNLNYRSEGSDPKAVNPEGTSSTSNIQEPVPIQNRMIEVFPLVNQHVFPHNQTLQSVAAQTIPRVLQDNSRVVDNDASLKSPQNHKKTTYTEMSPQERIAFLQEALEQEKKAMDTMNAEKDPQHALEKELKSMTNLAKNKSKKITKELGSVLAGRKLRSELRATRTRSGSTMLKSDSEGRTNNKNNTKLEKSENKWKSEFAKRSSEKAKKYLGADKQNNRILPRGRVQNDKAEQKHSSGIKSVKDRKIEQRIKRLQNMLDKSQPIEINRSRAKTSTVAKKCQRDYNDDGDNPFNPALKNTKGNYSDIGKRKKCSSNGQNKKELSASLLDEECRKKVKTVKLDETSGWKKMIKKCDVTLKPIKISSDRKIIWVTENAHVYKRVDLLYLLEGDDFFTYKNVTFKKHLLRVKDEPEPRNTITENIKTYHETAQEQASTSNEKADNIHEELKKSNETNVKTPPKSTGQVKKSRSVARKRSYFPFGICSSPTKKPLLEGETIVLSDDDKEDDGIVYNASGLDDNDSEEDEVVKRQKWLERLLLSESSRALRANRGPKALKVTQEEEEEDFPEMNSSKTELQEPSTACVKMEVDLEKETDEKKLPELSHVKKEDMLRNEQFLKNETNRPKYDTVVGTNEVDSTTSGLADAPSVKKEVNLHEDVEESNVLVGEIKYVKKEN